MKKLLLIIFFICILHAQNVNDLLVLPLKVEGNNKDKTIVVNFNRYLERAIAKANIYNIKSRTELKKVFSEENIDAEKLYDFNYLSKYLSRLSAHINFFVVGEFIFQDTTTVAVSIRLVQVKDGAILKSAALHGARDFLEKLANELSEKIMPDPEGLLEEIKKDFISAYKSKDFVTATNMCDWALKVRSQHPHFLFFKGLSLEQRNLYLEAEENYNEALRYKYPEEHNVKEALLRIKPFLKQTESDYKSILKNLFVEFEKFEKENSVQQIIDISAELQQHTRNIQPLQNIIDEAVVLKDNIKNFVLWMNRLHGSDVSEKNKKIVLEMLSKIGEFRKEQQKILTGLQNSYQEQYNFFVEKGIAAKKNKNMDESLKQIELAFLLNPKVAEVHYHRGIALGKKYNYNEAVESFTKAIQINGNYWESYYNRAMTYLEMGKKETAYNDLGKANQISAYAPAYFEMGKILADKNQLKKAAKAYSRAISLDSTYAEAYYERGKLYDQMELYVLSSQDYKKAMLLDSALAARASPLYDKSVKYVRQQALIYLELGQDAQKYGDLSEAMSFYDKTIDLNNKIYQASFYKGQIFHILQKYENAISSYTSAIDIEKEFPQLYIYRAVSFQKIKQYEKALQDIEKALEYEPNLPDVYQLRGRIYERMERLEAALQSYDIAVKLLPSKSHYYLDRARIYNLLGNKEMAKQDLIRARSIK